MNSNRSDLKTKERKQYKSPGLGNYEFIFKHLDKKETKNFSSDSAINKLRINSPEMIDINDRIHDLF